MMPGRKDTLRLSTVHRDYWGESLPCQYDRGARCDAFSTLFHACGGLGVDRNWGRTPQISKSLYNRAIDIEKRRILNICRPSNQEDWRPTSLCWSTPPKPATWALSSSWLSGMTATSSA